MGRAVVRFSGSISMGADCVEFNCVPVSGIGFSFGTLVGTFFVSCWKVGGGVLFSVGAMDGAPFCGCE